MLSGTPINWNETLSTAGEDPAFYERLLPELRTVAAQMLPRKAATDREEVVQKAMIKLWKMLEKGTMKRSALARGYLRRVAYSVYIDDLRGLQRRQEEPFQPEVHDVRVAEAAGPETIAVSRELGRGIRSALRQLNDDRRHAVTLHLRGHSVGEVASILGYGYKKAENLINRGRGQLRTAILSVAALGYRRYQHP